MKRAILSSVLLATCVTLGACNNAERKADNAVAAVDRAADAAGNRIESTAGNAMAAMTPTPNPQDFVNRAAKSDAFEIAAAKLAMEKTTNPQVKTFAGQMISAHSDSTAKIKAAAGKAKPVITPDANLTADQKEELAELGRLSGAKFDEEYVDGQVDAHEDALALMRAFATDGTDAGLKATAAEIAPVVEGHLKMARELEAKTDT